MLLFLNVCEQIFHIRTCAYQEVNVNIALNIYGSVVYGSFIYYVRKIFRKTNISYPLIRIHPWAYQGVRNVTFSGIFRLYWMDDTSQTHLNTCVGLSRHYRNQSIFKHYRFYLGKSRKHACTLNLHYLKETGIRSFFLFIILIMAKKNPTFKDLMIINFSKNNV